MDIQNVLKSHRDYLLKLLGESAQALIQETINGAPPAQTTETNRFDTIHEIIVCFDQVLDRVLPLCDYDRRLYREIFGCPTCKAVFYSHTREQIKHKKKWLDIDTMTSSVSVVHVPGCRAASHLEPSLLKSEII